MQAILKRLNPILKGWYGYFKHASAEVPSEMNSWVHGRLRSILLKRRKG
jgi:RNA-directed DNA polymerase